MKTVGMVPAVKPHVDIVLDQISVTTLMAAVLVIVVMATRERNAQMVRVFHSELKIFVKCMLFFTLCINLLMTCFNWTFYVIQNATFVFYTMFANLHKYTVMTFLRIPHDIMCFEFPVACISK